MNRTVSNSDASSPCPTQLRAKKHGPPASPSDRNTGSGERAHSPLATQNKRLLRQQPLPRLGPDGVQPVSQGGSCLSGCSTQPVHYTHCCLREARSGERHHHRRHVKSRLTTQRAERIHSAAASNGTQGVSRQQPIALRRAPVPAARAPAPPSRPPQPRARGGPRRHSLRGHSCRCASG